MSLAPVMPKSAWRASPMPLTAQPRTETSIGSVVGLQPALDLRDDRVHVELQAAAGRAGDQHRAALAQLERLEDLPGDLDLFLGVEGGQRDPDRVADAVGEQRAEADRALERARPLRARLGDAEVQRVVDLLAQQAVRRDRVRDRGRLERDLEVLKRRRSIRLDELDGGGDERLDRVRHLEVVQVLGQRAGVHADAQRRAGRPGAIGDLGDLLGPADVARVQADAVRARVDRLQRQRVVEVDVGDDRDRRLAHDRLERLDVLLPRDGAADDVRAGVRDPTDLIHRGLQVGRFGLGHRLDRDRSAPADLDTTDVD